MKLLKFSMLLIVMSFFTMAFVSRVYAQDMRVSSNNCYEIREGFQKNFSDLTEEQKLKIQEKLAQYKKDAEPLKKELKEKETGLSDLMASEKPDMTLIDKTVKEIGTIRTNLMTKGVNVRLDLRSVLTSEQKKIFDEQSKPAPKKDADKKRPQPKETHKH